LYNQAKKTHYFDGVLKTKKDHFKTRKENLKNSNCLKSTPKNLFFKKKNPEYKIFNI